MDMRDMRGGMGDGRNPYGSRGGYVVSSRGGRGRGRGRGRRGDRGMDYAEDMARGGRGGGRGGDRGMDYGMYPEMRDGRVIRSYPTMYPQGDYARGDMNYDMARGDYAEDMRGGDYRGDMHHGGMRGNRGGYEPVEFMGYCSGYYGAPQDYGRRGDYGYDMRGRRDYGYDYGYDDYGDYGEALSDKELDEWCHKLKSKLDEREKQMFSKEIITQKAKQMGKEMKDFGEKELEVVTIMLLDDYKRTLGVNPDVMIKLAFDWLNDEDAKLRGAQKLAVYYDEIVMGGEDD